MLIRVDLLPGGDYQDVVILIDVLRSCSVAPLLFDNGLERLALTPSLKQARAAGRESRLLVGERGGLPPEGFNYGNSLAELSRVGFAGDSVIMVSENAPKALGMLAGAREVLLGSLYNAAAVTRTALTLAESSVALVCCGFRGQEDLDDAVAAGMIASLLKSERSSSELGGASRFSMTLFRTFRDPLEALWVSIAGRHLRSLKLDKELAIASLVSHSQTVPRLADSEPRGDAMLYHFEPNRIAMED